MLRVFTPKDIGLVAGFSSIPYSQFSPPKRPQEPASFVGGAGDGVRRLGVDGRSGSDGSGDDEGEDKRNTVITIRDNDIMQVMSLSYTSPHPLSTHTINTSINQPCQLPL